MEPMSSGSGKRGLGIVEGSGVVEGSGAVEGLGIMLLVGEWERGGCFNASL